MTDLAEYGAFTWWREGSVVHFSFVGFDAYKPAGSNTIVSTSTYYAE